MALLRAMVAAELLLPATTLSLITPGQALQHPLLADQDPAALSSRIATASEIAANVCEIYDVGGVRTFAREQIREKIRLPEPFHYIRLCRCPATITEILCDDEVIDPEDYFATPEGGIRFTNQIGNDITVTYDAGYVTPAQLEIDNTLEGPRLPGTIQTACMLILQRMLSIETQERFGLVAETYSQDKVDMESYRYDKDSVGRFVPPEAMQLLTPYLKVWM